MERSAPQLSLAFLKTFRKTVIMDKAIVVEIKVSRHARQRAKLYGISRPTISEVLTRTNLSQGSLKIVVGVANLAYPLKRGDRK